MKKLVNLFEGSFLFSPMSPKEIEEKGLDLTDYPVFYIGYEMLEPKWEEESTSTSGVLSP